MEITQFTYMQQAGGMDGRPVPVELTYGLERIGMFIDKVPSVFDMPYSDTLTYGQVRLWEEQEISKYYFEVADVPEAVRQFDFFEAEAERCLGEKLILPAYERTQAFAPLQHPRRPRRRFHHQPHQPHPAHPPPGVPMRPRLCGKGKA